MPNALPKLDAKRPNAAAAEEARRQATLAEQASPRELAARQARERHIAFERGLRNETAENISQRRTPKARTLMSAVPRSNALAIERERSS